MQQLSPGPRGRLARLFASQADWVAFDARPGYTGAACDRGTSRLIVGLLLRSHSRVLAAGELGWAAGQGRVTVMNMAMRVGTASEAPMPSDIYAALHFVEYSHPALLRGPSSLV